MTRLTKAHPDFCAHGTPARARMLSEVTRVCYTVLINSAYPL